LADVRAFCVVVRAGSFTAAARLLGERKTQVSRRVARLEHALGFVLLRRHARSIEVEAPARELAPRLEAALATFDEAFAAGARTEARWPTLRVTAPSDLGPSVVAPVLGAWLAATPEARVTLDLSERVESLEAGGADCAFRLARRLRDSSLVAHRLASMVAPLFASPTYVRERGTPKRPEQLPSHALVALPPTRGRLRLRPASGRGGDVEVNIDARAVADAASLVALCEAGAGIAAIPTHLAERARREGRLVPVLERFVLRETAALYFLHRRDPRSGARAAAVASLKAFAARAFAEPRRAPP